MSFPDVDAAMGIARSAMDAICDYDQEQIDQVVTALAWAIYRDDNARILAEIAVADTGLGKVADKILKNKRKTYGTLCDLIGVRSRGIVDCDTALGLTTYYKPVGVVGTLTPSTNPAATPANQTLMALKGGNSIIVSPSPAGHRTGKQLEAYFHSALDVIGAPRGLFQVLGEPINFAKASYLSECVDLLLVTGDQTNVQRGYQSGTPCIGVGKGNVPVIVDADADASEAAKLIAASKVFDNATSCSSENALVVLDDIYDAVVDELEKHGAYCATAAECQRIESRLFPSGKITRAAVGQDMKTLSAIFGLREAANSKRFIMVEQSEVGPGAPLSGEKLSLVLSLYRAADIESAIDRCCEILDYEGIGHSVGIHTQTPAHAKRLAERVKVARVLVNQAHTFGNGGGMNNGLPFTLTMGCGTWAGNSICENLSFKHFVNKTVLVETFDKKMPMAADSFGTLYDPELDQ